MAIKSYRNILAAMGGASSTAKSNGVMVENLVDDRYIRSDHVERAFRAVDRGHFFPETVQNKQNIYSDNAWRDELLHISSPCIYGEAIERLDLKPGQSFLNLGSGSGYLSTIAGHLIGSNGLNHGIELNPRLVKYAQERVETFKQNSSSVDMFEFCEPQFVAGNFLLLNTLMRYDRVYCGAACNSEEILEHLKGLLKIGGRLVSPVNNKLLQYDRISETEFTIEGILSVAFSEILPANHGAVPIQPRLEPKSLRVLSRDRVREFLRNKIYQDNPVYLSRHILTHSVNIMQKCMSQTDRQKNVRVKFDSGIVEDISGSSDTEDEEDEEFEEESEDESMKECDDDEDDDQYGEHAKEFSSMMRLAIKELELPKILMKFVNLNRDL